MLDEYAEEALDGAKERAMEHPRTLARVIGRAIRDVEALGQIEVDLHRRALPPAAERVLDLDVDLGAVEGAIAGVDLVWNATTLDSLAQEALGLFPHLVGADGLLGTRGYLGHVLEAELLHDGVRQVEDCADLVDDLILATEDMRIVLA